MPITELSNVKVDPAIADMLPDNVRKEWNIMLQAEMRPARIRTELTGMLPVVIDKIEILLKSLAALSPQVVRGYDATAEKTSFFYWGVAVRIECADMAAMKTQAEEAGFTWLSVDGDIAYRGGRSIVDFQSYRVNGWLELISEEEVQNG